MLKKLLKYDLKYIFKGLIVFHLLALFFAGLTRIFFAIDNSVIWNIIAQVCSGITISMIFNILINNVMRIWVRFRNNFYGDEAYLTHTLPVSKTSLCLSKMASAVITLFISFLVIGLVLFIAYYSKGNIELLKSVLFPVVSFFNSTMTKLILILLFIVFLEITCTIEAGYTGIILGHKMNNAKIAYSVLYGFITYTIIQIILLLTIGTISLFNSDFMNLFITNEITNLEVFTNLVYIVFAFYISIAIINFIINLKLFKKGVNVD